MIEITIADEYCSIPSFLKIIKSFDAWDFIINVTTSRQDIHFFRWGKYLTFDKIKRSIFCRSQKTGLVLGDVWILQLIMLIEVCEKMKWTAFELCKLQGKGWNGQVQVPHLMPYQRKIRMTSIWIGSTLGLFFCGSERYPQRKKLETVHPVYYSGGEGGLIMVTGSK